VKNKLTWIVSLTLAAGFGWLGATAFNASATGKEPRFPQLTMEQLNEQQRPVAEKIMKVSSVGLGGHQFSFWVFGMRRCGLARVGEIEALLSRAGAVEA
jgi:hypothetical protein